MIEEIFKTLPKRELAKSLVDLGFDKFEAYKKSNKDKADAVKKENDARKKEIAKLKELLKKLEK